MMRPAELLPPPGLKYGVDANASLEARQKTERAFLQDLGLDDTSIDEIVQKMEPFMRKQVKAAGGKARRARAAAPARGGGAAAGGAAASGGGGGAATGGGAGGAQSGAAGGAQSGGGGAPRRSARLQQNGTGAPTATSTRRRTPAVAVVSQVSPVDGALALLRAKRPELEDAVKDFKDTMAGLNGRIVDYGTVVVDLTRLLKRNANVWDGAAQNAMVVVENAVANLSAADTDFFNEVTAIIRDFARLADRAKKERDRAEKMAMRRNTRAPAAASNPAITPATLPAITPAPAAASTPAITPASTLALTNGPVEPTYAIYRHWNKSMTNPDSSALRGMAGLKDLFLSDQAKFYGGHFLPDDQDDYDIADGYPVFLYAVPAKTPAGKVADIVKTYRGQVQSAGSNVEPTIVLLHFPTSKDETNAAEVTPMGLDASITGNSPHVLFFKVVLPRGKIGAADAARILLPVYDKLRTNPYLDATAQATAAQVYQQLRLKR
jgi:hypothetical protein